MVRISSTYLNETERRALLVTLFIIFSLNIKVTLFDGKLCVFKQYKVGFEANKTCHSRFVSFHHLMVNSEITSKERGIP